jgi:uncharacterized phage protein (TIGR02218 family)
MTFDSQTFTAKPISCGPIRQTGDSQSDEFTITVPTSIDFVTDFNLVPPAERVQAIVRRVHVGDSDGAVRFHGFVDRVKRRDRTKTDVICKSLGATFRRAGVRLPWQRQCPHALYDVSCRVNKAAHAHTGIVTAINGVGIAASGLSAAGEGQLNAGFVEWTTASGFKAWRLVLAHAGDTVALLGGSSGIEVGMTVVAYRGCQRTAEYCNSVFNNLANFGGFRHLPSKSPFSGDPVF